MQIYVEYAFLENFCVDATIIFLSFYLLKIPVCKRNVLLGGIVGGGFAVVYPFLSLTIPVLSAILKTFFPFILCKIGFGRNTIAKKRYLVCVTALYVTSFLFAGGIYALCGVFSAPYAYVGGIVTVAPFGIILCGIVLMIFVVVYFFKKVYRRHCQTERLFRCKITVGNRSVVSIGFLDSGNTAKKNGKPICFLSPDLFYDLFGDYAFGDCEEELAVTSVVGDKKIKLWEIDELGIYLDERENIIKKLWVSPSYRLVGREYKLLFGAWAFEEGTEVKE